MLLVMIIFSIPSIVGAIKDSKKDKTRGKEDLKMPTELLHNRSFEFLMCDEWVRG